MVSKALLTLAAMGFLVSSAQAVFNGTVDFEDGTTGALTKELDTSNHQAFTIGDFGGPGNLEFNYNGNGAPAAFKSTYLLADTSGVGAGDVYGDVTIRALYKPSSNGFEFALSSRVLAYPAAVPNSASGWGIWASGGTGGPGGFAQGLNIAYEPEVGNGGSVRATVLNWVDASLISIDSTKWYDVIFSTIGTTATATMTELDASFLPVTGHTATVSYNMNTTPSEYTATGFVGTRGAQVNASTGYFLDNVQITPEGVPEPASLMLLGLGGIALLRRRNAP